MNPERPAAMITVEAGERAPRELEDEPIKVAPSRRKKFDLNELDAKKDAHEDHSEKVDAELPKIRALAAAGQRDAAIEQLYSLEKLTRQGGDSFSAAKVVSAIVELCLDARDFAAANAHLTTLAKKRGQLKQALIAMVQTACGYVEKLGAADKAQMLELIDVLRTITEGKIYVENERARLTKKLAAVAEAEGDIKKAAELLQEIQVETFGSMDKREKTDFLLEQVRLCLDSNDFTRAQILARKVAPKVLIPEDMQDLKIKNARLLIRFYIHKKDYLEVAKCYYNIFDTKSIKADPEAWQRELRLVVAFALLAPFSNEQNDLVNRLALDKKHLLEVPEFGALIKLFLTPELIMWAAVEANYKPAMLALAGYTGEELEGLWKQFRERVIEKNIRVVADYYTQIRTQRLAQLLALTTDETEDHLCRLVVAKMVWARVDRPAGIVSFQPKKKSPEVLNDFGADISSLMEKVEKTCHLIHLETMTFGKK